MSVNISHAILTVTLDSIRNSSDVFNTYSISNSSDVFNTYEYLNKEMGEKRQGMVAVITLTIVYCVIFVTGIVGNMSTCVVIGRNPYLHTATNYYLLSLAVSDMFTLLLGLPPELYSVWEAYPWRFGEAFCIFKSFFSEMTSYASVLTITAFTGERYVAICYPIKSQTFSNLRRAVRLIFLIWFVACICALPFPIHTRLFYYLKYPNTTQPISESLQCNIPLDWIDYMKSMFQISSFVFFVLPMAIISIMYILIGLTLKRSHFNKNSSDDFCKLEAKEAARKAVIKMLVAVVVAFFVCWAPFHAQRLMTVYVPQADWSPILMTIQSHLFYISGVLYFFNATINPILYNLMSKKFRTAFVRTLCRCCFSRIELAEMRGTTRSVMYSERIALNGRMSVYGRDTPTLYTNGTLYRSTEIRKHPRSTMLHVNGLNYSERNLLHAYSNEGHMTSRSLNTSPVHSPNHKRNLSYDLIDQTLSDSLNRSSSRLTASTSSNMLVKINGKTNDTFV